MQRFPGSLVKRVRLSILFPVATLTMLAACQGTILYHPAQESEEALLRSARSRGLEPWPEAGENRLAWRAAAVSSPENRIVVFHGNAGHALHRDYYARGFEAVDGGATWEVFLFEYPGYGSRPGDPDEQTLVAAGIEMVQHLIESDPDRPVHLLGESLGSGVASQVAAAFPQDVSGVILVTPFTSIVDVGAASFPRFLVRAVLRDRYDNESALAGYPGRVGVLIAGEDSVVPAALGHTLYEGLTQAKRLWVQESAGHNSLDFSPHRSWWKELTEFLLSSHET